MGSVTETVNVDPAETNVVEAIAFGGNDVPLHAVPEGTMKSTSPEARPMPDTVTLKDDASVVVSARCRIVGAKADGMTATKTEAV